MKRSKALMVLASIIAGLAVIAAAVGLLAGGGPGQYTFTTLRGQPVTIYGQGLYRYDSLLIGSGYRGNDAVTLLFAVPLLGYALAAYRRGSLRGGLLLAGALGYFLYAYASMALGAAYNNLFLVYLLLFSASLFAFIRAMTAFDLAALGGHVSGRLPRRALVIYLWAVAAVLVIVWFGLSLLPPLLQGQAPEIVESYTTVITYTLDLGVIAPAAALAAVWLGRREPLGYVLSAVILVMGSLIGLAVSAATISQGLAGYPYTPGVIIALVVPFVVLTVGGLWAALTLFRNIEE